ncbi:hypothetical protein SADUNF_Sadunf01G0098600 [Salix dunnii]|uniref:Uncharacterized protein n=1 Tax=Salix dunnii TaxID=1413687 RepID=A0A835NAR4_9ROSI|nr:hypothetical protein SADUNF_Sadunf01G0098600 [Salix dunnii]
MTAVLGSARWSRTDSLTWLSKMISRANGSSLFSVNVTNQCNLLLSLTFMRPPCTLQISCLIKLLLKFGSATAKSHHRKSPTIRRAPESYNSEPSDCGGNRANPDCKSLHKKNHNG